MKTTSISADSASEQDPVDDNIEAPEAVNQPPLSFEKYLQWLTKITKGVPPSREISGPNTPFELYFPE